MNAIMHRDYESNAPVRFSWYEDRIEIAESRRAGRRRHSRELPLPKRTIGTP